MKKKKIASIAIVLCLLVSFAATIIVAWLYDTFGNLTINEIIFHLKVPMEGSNNDLVWDAIKDCLWKILVLVAGLSFVLIYPIFKDLKWVHKVKTSESKKTVKISVGISIVILMINIIYLLIATNLIGYIYNQLNDSEFIENEYVNPEEANVEFPEEKRNLIYIFLESMEATFYDQKKGGLAPGDIIPEISKLAEENIDFSTTSKLGGAHALYGATWTAGAMTAQTTGLPLKIGVEKNSLSEYSEFLSGAYSIGEILEENGYQNFLMVGSDATFGGRRNLFTQHGNYDIWDFNKAKALRRVDEKIWWGFTDSNLFKFAKEKISMLSKDEEPFNFTMLTVDTHFEDGYECDDCPNTYPLQYKNVLACSSKKVGEFVEWIQAQDFYENTTIVIAGDHLTMQPNFYELPEGSNYNKKVVTAIINPGIEATETTREYSTFDLYPTTLAALGAEIEGDKLGLGVNLFSDEKTLIEKYGLDYVNEELMKTSKFYDNNILVSK